MPRREWSVGVSMPTRAQRAAKERADAAARGPRPDHWWVGTDRESGREVAICQVAFEAAGAVWRRSLSQPPALGSAQASPFLANIRRIDRATGEIVL